MTRSEEIRSKGFDMFGNTYTLQDMDGPLDYRKIKVGVKNLDDAVLNLGSYNSNLPKYNGISKGMVMRALADNDLVELRTESGTRLISNTVARSNGLNEYFKLMI